MSTPRPHRRRKTLLGAALPLSLALTALPAATAVGATDNPYADGPAVESRVKDIITVDGEEFRDLDDDGELDHYEDWRRPVDQRVDDLVGKMTLEEKSGLMLIDTMNADCDGAVPETADDYVNTQSMHRFIFRNSVAAEAACSTGGRGGATITPAQAAQYTNAVQEMTEATRLGIPALFKSNARNHVDPNARVGINVSAGAFSAFPKEAGIAAAALGDEEYMGIVEDFTQVMGEEWESIGLRGMYGYMADLATEPRWYRTHETFTEDADLGADIMGTLVEGLQGPLEDGSSLSPDSSVALTMKHFPGGGPQELGLDPHYSFGQSQVYTGDGFAYNLRPFEAAIDAGVSAIMPYYGIPVDVTHDGVTYDHTGFAFSEQIVNDLLRDQLGFQGYVNSDTGIIEERAWGLEGASVPERVAVAVNGGTDTLSGFNQVSVITGLVADGLVTEERVDLAAERLLAPMFEMGLFEDPYVDPATATATVGGAEHREVALDTQRKSLVLLENDGAALPLESGSTLFVLGDFDVEAIEGYGYEVIDGNAEGVDPSAAADADYAVVNVTAQNVNTFGYDSRDYEQHPVNPIELPTEPGSEDGPYIPGLDGESHYGESDACVWGDAESCSDVLYFGGSYPWESSLLDFTGMSTADSWQVVPALDDIQQVMNAVGEDNTVLNVYFRQPYVLDEESGLRDAGAIVARFGASDSALFDVLSGEHDFQGKLPFALPATRDAVIEQASDQPGYAETTDGELFGYGHGLSYEDEEPTTPSHGFFLNDGWDAWADHVFQYGRFTDEVLIGDWNDDGTDTITMRRGNEFHVSNAQRGGDAEEVFDYGRPGDTILVGDWDGDGTDTLAVRRGNEYHIKNTISGGDADQVIRYGRSGDDVVVGDWDANNTDTLAVRRGSEYHVKNSIAGGNADVAFHYGKADDVVLAGDWDGDGHDTFAVRRGFTYHVKNSLTAGNADLVLNYGRADDEVYVGDWNGDATDTLGVRRAP